LSVSITKTLYRREINVTHEVFAKIASDRIAAFFANRQNFYGFTSRQQLFRMGLCQFGDVAVEATTKTAFCGHDDKQLHLVAARTGQQFWCRCGTSASSRQSCHHSVKTLCIRA
jgi:hypothetical protein